ncbi:4Fe-4S binding protein [Maridesulfovibrio sp.]|uniref:4Fe-4S binding protein n=1 Tax=Maridesulfovibrio sp. TaxID=2795000 RepID=UPI002A18A577|nr:4Fe-4S binding protein [Maridesulfovibrio sp.]
MSKKTTEKILAVATLCILAAAWFAGGMRSEGANLSRIKNISPEIERIKQISPSVYEGQRKGNPAEKIYIALAEYPSYGGPLQVAVVVNKDKTVERVALVKSTDTITYIDRVLNEGILDGFLGAEDTQLPEIDAVSGATLSSTAMIMGVQEAIAKIQGRETVQATMSLSSEEMIKAGLTVALFIMAIFIASRFFRWNKNYARLGLLALSTVLLGFMYGAQPSLGSIALFLSGLWTKGMASYTALICLGLAMLVFLATRKNLYCSMVCPFGGIQEGLGRITKCAPSKKTEWMKWTARIFALVALSAALYFRNPSDAQYAPFGMAFSFIGSDAVFALFVLIVVASLIVKRPWCTLLCPAGPVFDYIAFMRNWIMPKKKKEQHL